MAKRLDLDIQRFATGGGGEYYIEFFTAKGDYGQGSWIEVDYMTFQLDSVPTIEDTYLNYYGYSSLQQPHFMGWYIYGVPYTVEDLKTREFTFYGEPATEATAWVVDMAQYKDNFSFGGNVITDIKLNNSSIEQICFNGDPIWSNIPSYEGKLWIEYHNPRVDVSSGGTGEFAVFLVGDFCNWDTTQGILMQGTNGERKAELPLNSGETKAFKFYVLGWGDDGWQTSTYPTNQEGNIEIQYDLSYIFLQGGNTYEVPGANDTIISDYDYPSEK